MLYAEDVPDDSTDPEGVVLFMWVNFDLQSGIASVLDFRVIKRITKCIL